VQRALFHRQKRGPRAGAERSAARSLGMITTWQLLYFRESRRPRTRVAVPLAARERIVY
jgi:hypothetical protein